MTKINLGIHKRFLIIDSPIDFELLANFGTDTVKRSAGTWSIDCYKLLPEEYQKNYPVYNLQLIYDENKLNADEQVSYSFTDMDLGQALKGVNGQVVELTSMQLEQLRPYNLKINNLIDNFLFYDYIQPDNLEGFVPPLNNGFYYCKMIYIYEKKDGIYYQYFSENCIIEISGNKLSLYGKCRRFNSAQDEFLEKIHEILNFTTILSFEGLLKKLEVTS